MFFRWTAAGEPLSGLTAMTFGRLFRVFFAFTCPPDSRYPRGSSRIGKSPVDPLVQLVGNGVFMRFPFLSFIYLALIDVRTRKSRSNPQG